MGNYISSWAQKRAKKAKSDAIDRELEEDARRLKKECSILLLGSSGSGKSTIVKQIKISHQNGFTDEELMTYRPAIYRNTLESAQGIVHAMHQIGLGCVDLNNRINADRICDYRIDPSPNFVFSSEIAEAIHQLWTDPIIPKLMDHSSEFYIMDSAAYFFTNVRRIGSPNYRPTENDVLRAHLKSIGITETRFTIDQLQMHLFDVGVLSSERRKWIHFFESITSIIFCTALSEYDQVLLEEQNQNRMSESFILFESVVNSRWFLRSSIILFLNKIDVFETKLRKVPLERYFPEYSGGTDVDKACKYILWRFLQKNRARLSVYPYITQAITTDTTNTHLVSAAVRETIRQSALKGSGVL